MAVYNNKNSENQLRSDELISLSEAARLSGLSPIYLRRLVTQGEIWGMKIGRNWVTTAQAVNQFLARERKPGPKPKK
jgi:excisionase family DNA binding protein